MMHSNAKGQSDSGLGGGIRSSLALYGLVHLLTQCILNLERFKCWFYITFHSLFSFSEHVYCCDLLGFTLYLFFVNMANSSMNFWLPVSLGSQELKLEQSQCRTTYTLTAKFSIFSFKIIKVWVQAFSWWLIGVLLRCLAIKMVGNKSCFFIVNVVKGLHYYS